MRPILQALFYSLIFSLTSCIPVVRKIQDDIRNVTTYQWSQSKHANSKINRQSRIFHFTFKKEGVNNDKMTWQISSNFLVTNPDYKDTAYLITDDTTLAVQYMRIDDISYQEQVNKVETTTETTTNVNTESVTTEVPIETSSSTENRSKEVNNTSTTTSTSTNTGTKVDTEILNKVLSTRMIKADDNELLIKTLRANKMTLRIYNTDNDFWDIKFLQEEKAQIIKFLNNIADVNVR